MKYYLSVLTLSVLFVACGKNTSTSEEPETSVEIVLPEITSEVTVETLYPGTFYHELISNGKLAAKNSADLRFESAELIEQIFVKNGDRVTKGQPLASLVSFRISNRTAQTKVSLEQAKLEMQDLIIGQGYSLADSLNVPQNTMELIRIKSGYNTALAQYELAVHEEKNAILRAPFNGVVANLTAKPHNMSSTAEVFCTILETHNLEVDFTVLENELPLIKIGDRVEITPFSQPGIKVIGRISEINPVVDENGMVKVKAALQNNGKLFEGMNVRISVQRSLAGQLVIPKTALVLRSGKQVVFTYNPEEKKAYWNYVQTGLENASHYTVLDGLKEEDIVITSGNINLAHEAPVVIIENRQVTSDN